MSQVPKISVGPAKRPRNGFDRSETHIYSQPAGMLLPVMQMFLNPNDHVSIDTSSIVQAQTLQGRPFLGMKQNFAFYFVPARLMTSYSKAFFSALKPKNTLTSSSLSNGANGSVSRLSAPSFSPYQVFLRFAGIPIAKKNGKPDTTDVIRPDIFNDSRFHDGGIFGNDGRVTGNTSTSPGDLPVRLYRVYGDYVKGNNLLTDDLGYPLLDSYIRLCDMMKYGAMPNIGNSINITDITDGLISYRANLWYWLAYQKIYQDHFLDTNYEVINPTSYNVDDLLDSSTGKLHFDFALNSTSISRAMAIFSPRYVKYEKDLLSNIHPSPLFVDDVTSYLKTYVGNARLFNEANDTIQRPVNSSDVNVSAAGLRNLFAFDKMQQITSRAPKTYKGQMLAHYGVNVSDDMTESFYIGGFQKTLEVSPVIATADGTASDSSTNFGQQGAYIDNSQSGHVNFDAKEHGVLMCLSWFSPSSLYDADGIDAFNTKFMREDYFVPEAEDLGMQPIEYSRLLPPWLKYSGFRVPDLSGAVAKWAPTHIGDVGAAYRQALGYDVPGLASLPYSYLGVEQSAIDVSKIYGWQPRYNEFKSAADYIHGEFKTGRSMQLLTLHRPTPFNRFLGLNTRFPAYNDKQHTKYSGVPAGFLFVDPACTNEVVEVNYDGTEKTDPFRITTHFSVSYISDMSVSGLPKL